MAASPATDEAFANHTLAVAGKEDTDGDGTADTFVLIPNCASGETTADGRCTTATAVDANADGIAEAVVPMAVAATRDAAGSYAPGFNLLVALAAVGALAVAFLPRPAASI